jgi:hypothetical protein
MVKCIREMDDGRKWGKESYIEKSIGKERMGIIWLKAGIWESLAVQM